MSRTGVLWVALISGPLVWVLAFGAQYTISGWTCMQGSKLPLYVVSAVALLLVLTGMIAALRIWRTMGASWPGEGGGESARIHAIAISAIGLNVLFLVVLIGQAIPQILLAGCE